MKSIALPPNPAALIESTRAMGYSTPAAVADIIDNSIAASASQVDLLYDPFDSPYLAILDNGFGMNEEELYNAMQYGSTSPQAPRDEKDLGRYGLGMKTASLSQCRSLTVISWKQGHLTGCCWNIDEIIKTNDWSLGILEEEELACIPHVDRLKEYSSGTLVLWENLDRMLIGSSDLQSELTSKMNRVREHLSLVFHRYITGEEGLVRLTLRMNDLSVEAADPFLLSRSTPVMDEERIRVGKSIVRVRPYILPHKNKLSQQEIQLLGGNESFRAGQGFYVYRNKRLVVWGTWFRLRPRSDLTDLARVQIDISNELDEQWTLDVKKSTAVPPEGVRRGLKRIINAISERSIRVYETRGRREVEPNDKQQKLWVLTELRDHTVRYEINRDHPLVKHVVSQTPKSKQSLDILLRSIEDAIPLQQLHVDIEKGTDRIANNDAVSETDIRQQLSHILACIENPEQRFHLLEKLKLSEPFCYHEHVINEFEETING